MNIPTRTPVGARTVSVVNANLFQLAEQYLGDATQWGRIADLNSVPGVAPDFIIAGPVNLMIPATNTGSDDGSTGMSIEQILFGVTG